MPQNVPIETETILYSGRNSLAEGYWLRVLPPGDNRHFLCTTRNGQLCYSHSSHITGPPSPNRTAHIEVDPALNSDPARLIETLVRLWEEPWRDDGGRPDTGELPPRTVHYFNDHGDRPAGATHFQLRATAVSRDDQSHPEISYTACNEEAPYYDIQMDWAWPYCLVAQGRTDTQLIPFDLGESRILGREVPGARQRHPVIRVRFLRIDDPDSEEFFDVTRTYVTERWDGTRWRRLSTSAIRLNWTRQRVDGYDHLPPEWFSILHPPPGIRERRRHIQQLLLDPATDPRTANAYLASFLKPRLQLPHNQNFILLHKFFLWLKEAYKLRNAFFLARGYVERDLNLLGHLDRLFDLTAQCNSDNATVTDDQVTRNKLRHGLTLTDHFRQQALAAGRQLDNVFDYQSTGSPANPGVFMQMINFWGDARGNINPSFRDVWTNDWYRFDNFLGPLTFMELALWVIRQSPHHASDFYQRFGRQLVLPPPSPGHPITAQSAETNNPMLVNPDFKAAFSAPAQRVFSGQEAMSWVKSALSTYGKVNDLFMLYHVSTLFSWHHNIGFRGAHPLGRFRTTVSIADLKGMVRQLSGMSLQQAEDFLQQVLHNNGQAPTRLTPQAFRRAQVRIDAATQFPGHSRLPSLLNALDTLIRVAKLMQMGDALLGRQQQWDGRTFAQMSSEFLGLSSTAASLLADYFQTVESTAGAVAPTTRLGRLVRTGSGRAFIFGPFIIAAGLMDTGMALEAAARCYGDGNVLGMGVQMLKCYGAFLGVCGNLIGYIPGVGTGVSILVGTAGFALSLAADLAQLLIDGRQSTHQQHAGQIYNMLMQKPANTNRGTVDRFLAGLSYAARGNQPMLNACFRHTSATTTGVGPFRRSLAAYFRQKGQWSDHRMGPDNMRLEAIIIDNTGTLTAGPLADRPQNTWNRFPVWLWEYTDRPHGRPASTAEQNRYYEGCWNRGHTPRQFLSRDRDTLDQEWAAMPAPDQWQQPRHLQRQ